MNNPKPKLFYTIQRGRADGSYRFEHLYVKLFDGDGQSRFDNDELFTLQWQGDHETDHWYGFHLRLDGDSAARALDFMKVAQTILRRLRESNVLMHKVPAVLAAIEAMKIPRRVYDDRESAYLPLAQVKSADYVRYMAWLDDSCVLSALARNHDEATEELIQAFAREIAGGHHRSSGYAVKMERWLAAGKPVRQDHQRTAPDVRELAEILKPMKEPVLQVAA